MQFLTPRKAGREGGWLPGLGREPEGACTECPLDTGPARTQRPAVHPGTPTWPKFLDGSEAGTSLAPAHQARTTRAWRTWDGGDARGKFTPGARGDARPLPRVGSGRGRRAGRARGGSGTARPAGTPERAWARAPRGCTAWPCLRWCRGSAAKRGRGPAPCKPLPERGSRGCGRCLFKVTACSGTTWGGQLGTGHLTDSGVTSGSPLVCGTRSA